MNSMPLFSRIPTARESVHYICSAIAPIDMYMVVVMSLVLVECVF